MSNYLIQEATLTSLADNIRRIKNLTATMSAEDMITYLDAIETRTSSDLTVSGPNVTVPAGYYAEDADTSVNISSRYYPLVSINTGSGLITASTEYELGYVTDNSTLESTLQLTTQAAKTITPTTSEQTAVASGVYTTGAVKVAAMPTVTRASTTLSGTADDTNDTITYTASNNQGTGYVTGSNQTATKTVTLTTSGATVTASDGTASVSKSVALATQATPSVSIDSSTGKVTATATQAAGYVTEGTRTGELQLTAQAAKTVTPSTSSQTAVAAGRYTTGAVTVAAIPSNYIDTSSADATAVDIVTDKTAYVNGSKITGTNPYVKDTTDAEVTTQADLITDLQTVLAGKVAGTGGDTSDATAVATDIAEGKTAYVNGVKLTGTIPETDWFEEYSDGVSYSDGRITMEGLQHAAGGPQRQIVNYGARLDAAASDFGDATAADVMSGKTFTSSAGLAVTGTGALLETEPYPAYEFVLAYNDRESYGWGFTKSTTEGYTDYYESENAGEGNSAAYCVCYFNVWTVCDVTFSVMNSGESIYDYGVVGPLDTIISSDNSNAAFNFSGTVHTAPVNITFSNVSVGQHRVQFKYQKDSSVNSNSDCFRFKLNTAPNTAAVLTDASKELVRSMEHNAKSYYIMSGIEILGVTGTYDNSIKNCTITTSGFTGYSYWTKANYSSLIMQRMTTASSSYTMSNVACGSVFVIYAPGYYFVDSEYFEYSDEITLITTGNGWAVFAAPDTANYSGTITWTGGAG